MYEHIQNPELRRLLLRHHEVHDWLDRLPYSIQLYVEASDIFAELGYPDLAIGAAYKALLLVDAIEDDTDEYHEEALADAASSLTQLPVGFVTIAVPSPDVSLHTLSLEEVDAGRQDPGGSPSDALVDWITSSLKPLIHRLLAENLLRCGCYRSAYKQCQRSLQLSPEDERLSELQSSILDAVSLYFAESGVTPSDPIEADQDAWPDASLVRRECYPWNDIEPDRFSQESLDAVNHELSKYAPKLEVKAVNLPALTADSTEQVSKQLGVFAKEDLAPGEVILDETSLLTANNRLQDTLCDACGVDIDSKPGQPTDSISCDECYILFCSETCLDAAMSSYHPAVCDKDVDSIARDVPPAEAADSLYLLLLLRSLAMASTQDVHPLSLPELRFIWADYHSVPLDRWTAPTPSSSPFASFPRTLPFHFSTSVELPFHLLTKMDVNIFTSARSFDVWVFNTLAAKFRGTASARFANEARSLGGLKMGKRHRGPEVSAVHPNWCLANHSCDPNVEWEWGGRLQFRVRAERQTWRRHGEERERKRPGIGKGEEVLSHYCDVGLDVRGRREWAVGALGGSCRCERCVWEAGE